MQRPARSACACISTYAPAGCTAAGCCLWFGQIREDMVQSFSLLSSMAVTALLQDGLLILSAKFGIKEVIAEAELAEQRHRRGGPNTSGSASADGGPQQPASPVQRRTRRPTWQPGKL